VARDPNKHHRRSIRLSGWDYRQAGAFFATLVTQGRETLFGQIVNGEMMLSPLGRVVMTMWQRLPSHFSQVRLDEFIVMPNHLHGIIWLLNNGESRDKVSSVEAQFEDSLPVQWVGQGTTAQEMSHPHRLESGSLGAVVGNFKSVTTRRINQMRHSPGAPVWQRNYYEHIVRDEHELNTIRQYILDNPSRWEEDDEHV
jgi:putative transposase